ncbi:hypothetical protein GALLR39Z86_06070 [Glycomyces algeriensis]|uniref:Uncharacterized protein n=2 Tax=Glycomyces algeriensis TaxID=256037 RepID=A0A9W6G5L2_9ACTN|nr:hypothetical protein GALLR39Z86_06070 [Glycomyces algeriensis]
MWAVIDELVGAELTDVRIGEALDQAEVIGTELVRTGWNSMFAEVPTPRPAAAPEPSAALGQEQESAPTAMATASVGHDSEDDSTDPGVRTVDATGDQGRDRKGDGLEDQGRQSDYAGDRPCGRESDGPAHQTGSRTESADQETTA